MASTTSSKHLVHFEGGNALSSFRATALLARLQAVSERIAAVHARHVHWVWTEAALDGAARDKLAALLDYGDRYEGPSDGVLIVSAPRLGTLSPWASKATDIAHNCGLDIQRVERVTEYRLTLKSGLLGGLAGLAGAGVTLGFGFFFFNELCGALGKADVLTPAMAAWTPPIVALLAGLTLLCYTEDG